MSHFFAILSSSSCVCSWFPLYFIVNSEHSNCSLAECNCKRRRKKKHLQQNLISIYFVALLHILLIASFSFFFLFCVQDRHVKRSGGDVEPVVDPSQDYVLMLGYENATHTVMRFKRKLETCDTSYDMAITVSSRRFFQRNTCRISSIRCITHIFQSIYLFCHQQNKLLDDFHIFPGLFRM